MSQHSGTDAGATAGTVSRTVEVAAPPERVWAVVSDLPGMGALSPENRGGRWTKGEGPRSGAVFVGRNGRGRRRWSTRCTVVRSEPGRAFAFEVASTGQAVARWSYELEPTREGCRLTESWEDRRGAVVRSVGRLVSGVGDREAFTATSIEQTLARVKQVAEADQSV